MSTLVRPFKPLLMVMHLTLFLLVGLFAIKSQQQCPSGSAGCSGGCPSSTTTPSPVAGGCPTTTSSPTSQTSGGACPCSNPGAGPSPGYGAGCDSCPYPAVCSNPQASANEPADADSPYYDQVISSSLYTPGLDNNCLTIFPLGNSSSLVCHSRVFDDGSFEIDIRAVYGYTGFTGVYRGEGLLGPSGCSTCVFNDFILGGLKGVCKGSYAFYRCYLFGDCVDTYKGTDTLTGYSIYNLYNISDQCKRRLISFMQSKNLNSTEMVMMPNKMPHQCVTRIGGLRCYRADSIEPGTGLSLP